MKNVWECDFCKQTGTEELIEKHENECVFNPKMKICFSCSNRQVEGAPISGYWNACSKGLQCDSVEDSKIPCELWEEEE